MSDRIPSLSLMTWNWQQPDWPHFTWNQARLAAAEKEFLVASGMFMGAIKHLGDEERNQLIVDAMSTEALTTLRNRRGSSRSGQRSVFHSATARSHGNRPQSRPCRARHIGDDGRSLQIVLRANGQYIVWLAPDADGRSARSDGYRALSHQR